MLYIFASHLFYPYPLAFVLCIHNKVVSQYIFGSRAKAVVGKLRPGGQMLAIGLLSFYWF